MFKLPRKITRLLFAVVCCFETVCVNEKLRACVSTSCKGEIAIYPARSVFGIWKFERFPCTKKFRKFRLGCKWHTKFWFVPLKIFPNKRNSWKGSPVFPVETSQWKICVPFTDFSPLSPVPCLSRSFKRPGLPRLPRVWTKMAADQGQKTSEFEINHTNANTCFWSGIGGLLNECRCGTLPVAWATLQRPSIVPRDIRKWLVNSSSEYPGNACSK